MLASQPGQLVAELEGLELTPDKANFETLRDIAASHVVKTPLPRCRLVKKEQCPLGPRRANYRWSLGENPGGYSQLRAPGRLRTAPGRTPAGRLLHSPIYSGLNSVMLWCGQRFGSSGFRV
jgi:hypothetical protein